MIPEILMVKMPCVFYCNLGLSPFSALCAFRPKQLNGYFQDATADDFYHLSPYPGFRFASPGAIDI
jgi:hypothetical protein